MLKHLFLRKKINLTQNCFNKDGECKYLERIFINAGMSRILWCRKCDREIKHNENIAECNDYIKK